MATDVSICSNALGLLGEKTITSLTDGSTRATLCNQFYAETRDEVLRGYKWKFAIKRDALAQDALYVASWDWQFGFTYPSDCLLVLSTSIDPSPWTHEGDWVVCNESAISIRYIKRVTDSAKFDAHFVPVLEASIAMKLCKPITGSLSALGNIAAIRDAAVREARTVGAMEAPPQVTETNDLIDCR